MLRRVALRTAGTLMPQRAAGWFERHLLTPYAVRDMATEVPQAAARDHRFPYGSGWLAARAWGDDGSDRPTILLLHGWGGSMASLGAFVDPLVGAGFRVVAFDAPAHGTSDGRQTNIVECTGATLQVGRAFGPLAGVVAHSFGSLMATYAMHHGLATRRLVLLGPPQDLMDLSMEVGEAAGFPRHVCELMATRIAARLRIDWRDLEIDRLVATLETPILVVHDRDDRTVPWSHGAAVAEAAPHGTLVSTAGLGHRGLLTDPDVIRRATAFVTG